MKYKILLKNKKTGETAVIVASARECVESLSARIKVALSLPYADHGWHRFIARGFTYVIEEHTWLEPEFRAEYDLKSGPYRSSEKESIGHIFTSLGSTITYTQDDDRSLSHYHVRCTFIGRV